MTPSKIKVKISGLAIVTGIILLVIAGGCLTNGINVKNTPATPTVTELQPTPVPLTTAQEIQSAYCFVQEVQPGYIQNETIVHLSSEDLTDFPQYGIAIKKGKNNTLEWYNGHRFVADFNDNQPRFEAFRNLSCKNIPDPSCDPWKTPEIFEYDGQYYEMGCLPGFGSLKPPPLNT